ncbi:MAG TPA: NADH-quinone oxidoreductase subunit C [Gammaproteobacteria bacterium]|nr:NADH-quinone oxidoreductase subunit C [Gammaproteobacteria bacterium]
MDTGKLGLTAKALPGAAPVRIARVDAEQLRALCQEVMAEGGLLQAMWASDERDRDAGFLLRVALQDSEGLLIAELPMVTEETGYPDLTEIFPAASRMQRAVDDLLGLRSWSGDTRPWLRHAAWPADYLPLRSDAVLVESAAIRDEHYRFVPVQGEGVHEIAVGPVHAGAIEPGHFRFSVVGEKVLRLEERLGYAHKGIERRFQGMTVETGQRLAARVSGDSAVAFSWAYCMAVESLSNMTPPPRALWLRALWLERERIANHLGDLGALGNDAGFGMGLAQFSRLKEDLLRANERAVGARYPMDVVVPGGLSADLNDTERQALMKDVAPLRAEIQALREIYDDHAGLQDRFVGAGRVAPELARKLGLIGLAGRASGQAWDLRTDHPHTPYDQFDMRMCGRLEGDVAARVAVRFDETLESLRFCEAILDALPGGDVKASLATPATGLLGLGWVEGWRGPVLVALEVADDGLIRRCHPHDCSWQNWPVIEHAIIGNIVPDFPLINKSFNLSYSGHDL